MWIGSVLGVEQQCVVSVGRDKGSHKCASLACWHSSETELQLMHCRLNDKFTFIFQQV